MAIAATIYFDGEDKSLAQWQHYADDQSTQRLRNIRDEQLQSRVVDIQAEGAKPGALLGGINSETGWNNRSEFNLSWRMRFASDFLIEVSTETRLGNRALVYEVTPDSTAVDGVTSIERNDGLVSWNTYSINVAADLARSEPGNQLLAVNGMLLRGSVRVDDIQLSDDATTEPGAITSEEVSTTVDPKAVALVQKADDLQSALKKENRVDIGKIEGDVEIILDSLPVSESQLNSQMTPVAFSDGFVYTANIEHGPHGDVDGIDLRTVVRKGRQIASGEWHWESSVVEERTVFDPWHTAPSVEVDRDGFVHVVFNMHNTPWQYVRTTRPHDIQSFRFYGQAITQQQIEDWKFNNRTTFPSFGYAAIPGTQITYPRFEKDIHGELYLAYRFASRPKRSWLERTFATGVASYSTQNKSWSAIGAPLEVSAADFQPHPDAPETSIPFAAKTGWTAYHPSLVFDRQEGMGVFMLWRSGAAGARTSKPCFAWSDNKRDFKTITGEPLELPLQPEDCSNLGFPDTQGFYNIADSEMDSAGTIYLTLNPDDGAALVLTFNASGDQWLHEEAPAGAAEIFLDKNDNLWAVAAGPRIYKKAYLSSVWEEIYSDSEANQCYPRASVNEDGSVAFIHMHSCDKKDVTIMGIRLSH